uniref:Cnidarian restricted protein n=1 Tax=Clytia hemisphaerica TaxID=252671 RepID=A0A7M5XLP9_9CNID
MKHYKLFCFFALIAITVRSSLSKAIKGENIYHGEKIAEPPFGNEIQEEKKKPPVESDEKSPKMTKKPDDEETGNNPKDEKEKVTMDMLRKHCSNPTAIMDYIMCDNFFPVNIRNRNRVKGRLP